MRKDRTSWQQEQAIKLQEKQTLVTVILLFGGLMTLLLFQYSPNKQTQAPKPEIINSLLPDFSAIKNVNEKKRAFFNFLKPIVKQQNLKLEYSRAFIGTIEKSLNDDLAHQQAVLNKLKRMAKAYRVSATDPIEILAELKLKVDVIPESLVLAQAAIESAWGSSRFAKQANNLFGQWCFNKGCGVVPNNRGEGKFHEIKRFNSPNESVASYFKNLNSHPAYHKLRLLRAQLKASNGVVYGSELASELTFYSEERDKYVQNVQNLIRQNKLE